MTRPRNSKAAMVFCELILVLCGAVAAGGAGRPNVLFLFSDDQRFDTIHALGNREIKTPNLDRLVREGTAFTRAAIMGGGQGAICTPSRAMLMTGRTLFRATTTYTGNGIPTNAVTWPQALREHGYDTFGVGKWHNDRASYARSFSAGGPVFFGGMSDHENIPVHDHDPAGKFPKSGERIARTFSTELFADAAVRFIQNRKADDRPFGLYVAFTAPHDPRTPPAEFASMYPPDRIRLPASFRPEHPFDNGELKVRDEQLLPWPRTPEAVRKEIALYYGMITHLDAQIGRILQALDGSPFAKNTILVFAGDNGLAVGRHGLLGKQNLYEHSMRVPLLFAGPGIPGNRRTDALCQLMDVMPTLCELTGVPRPASAEGQSLAGILKGRQEGIRDALFAAYRMDQRAVREDRWKLIQYPKAGVEQLFDLRNDPDELNNVADQPRFRKHLDRLRARMASLQQELGDPMLANPADTRLSDAPSNPAMAPVVDNPKLPRVLLIGDSISIGYTVPTRQLLKDIANVHRIRANGGSTSNGLARIDAWLGDGRWDVIHFNWGLHDLKLNSDWSHWVPLPDYEANLEKLVARLKETGARLIWASTTPVPGGKLTPPRRPDDVIRYNRAAAAVMKRNGIPIDDLFATAATRLEEYQRPANVHFKPAGSEALARSAATAIREALRGARRP